MNESTVLKNSHNSHSWVSVFCCYYNLGVLHLKDIVEKLSRHLSESKLKQFLVILMGFTVQVLLGRTQTENLHINSTVQINSFVLFSSLLHSSVRK